MSERARLTDPTTHSTLLKMEELGYVTRQNMLGNKRRQHAFLTPEGWALRDKLEPMAVDANQIATQGLSNAELATVRRALGAIIDTLAKDEQDAARYGLRVPPKRGHGPL